MQKRWTIKEKSLLEEHYPLLGAKWCAKQLGRSDAAIMTRANKLGISLLKKNSSHKKLTDADVNEATRLYVEEGLSARQIGEQFGVKPDCVYSVLKRKGITRDTTGTRNRRWSDEEEAEIVARYPTESTTALALAFNTSMSSILLVLERHNVTRLKGSRGHRCYTYTDRNGQVIQMRSGWEVLVAFHLDSQELDWGYEVESYVLSICTKHNNPCVYTPDFWIYTHDGQLREVVDVKGRRTKAQDRRIEAFQHDYPDIPFAIWEERHLKTLGFTWRDLRSPQLIVGNRLQRKS